MKAGRLKEALALLPDDTEILVWSADTELTSKTYNITIYTDMRTGNTVLVVCAEHDAGNYRDFEHHPGFKVINAWMFD